MARTKGAYGTKWLSVFKDEFPDRPVKEYNSRHASEQYRFHQYILNHYGMTPSEYAKQNAPYSCPICQEPLAFDKRGVHLDHIHGTNEIRGILCRECNIMLGKARDNPYILLSAVAYLNKAKVK